MRRNTSHKAMLYGPPKAALMDCQAMRVIERFGGPTRLAKALAAVGAPKDLSTIYRWTYPREYQGTNGFIPTRVWPDIFRAARYDGLVLSADDIDPRTKPMDRFKARAFPKKVLHQAGE